VNKITTLQQLQYFCTLAKVKHYTKAAQSLYITQPALSHAISGLEHELGVALFEKRGKIVSLSHYGELFLAEVEPLLAKLDDTENKIRQMSKIFKGTVRIGYFYTFGFLYLPDLIEKLHNVPEMKETSIDLSLCIKNSEVIKGLCDGYTDLAFCCTDLLGKNDHIEELSYIPIAEQELLLALPINHPLAGRDKVDIEEIKDYPFIVTDKHTHLRYATTEIFRQAGLEQHIIMEMSEWQAMMPYVALDYGAAIIPQILNYQNDKIALVKIESSYNKRNINLAWLRDRKLTPQVENTKNIIIKLMAQN